MRCYRVTLYIEGPIDSPLDRTIATTQVLEAFAELVPTVDGWSMEEENFEGWRVNVDEGDGKRGWLLLRQSLHDPLLVPTPALPLLSNLHANSIHHGVLPWMVESTRHTCVHCALALLSGSSGV